MSSEFSCHLVDFISWPHTSISLTLGNLHAFAQAHPRIAGRCDFFRRCQTLGSLETAWGDIQDSLHSNKAEKHIFGFTNYFWNRPANEELARRIKAVAPEALVVFGGNEVTDQGDVILQDPAVDVVVNGEGEVIFANLLASYLDGNRDFRQVQGISFRDETGQIVTTLPQPRIDNLDIIPSPFLSGVYSTEQIKASREFVYEFSRGCPFKCAFCFWGAAVGTKTRRYSLDRIQAELEFLITHLENGARLWIADANFGMVEADVEVAEMLGKMVEKHGKRIYPFFNWAKNTSQRVVRAATILFRNRLITGVTLTAQTFNPKVLEIAERKNIPFEYYERLQTEFRQLGIPTYTELILGLPGESYESFRDGIVKVIESGGTPVSYPLLLLNNTEYSTPEIREKYQIRSRRSPYFAFNKTTPAEMVISHSDLPYKDWLRCIALRLAVPLFRSTLLKFIMDRFHKVYGLSYNFILDRLLDYCMSGSIKSHEMFRRVFANYMECWDCSEKYDSELIDAVLHHGTSGDFIHLEALIKVAMDDPGSTRALIEELARAIWSGHSQAMPPELPDWIEYQALIVEALRHVSKGQAPSLENHLPVATLEQFAGFTIAVKRGSSSRLNVRWEYRCGHYDVFIYRLLYGNIDTLQMFEAVNSPSAVSPGRDEFKGQHTSAASA